MRINLALHTRRFTNTTAQKFLHLMVKEFCQEYQIGNAKDVIRQIFLKNRELNELVADCLRHKGWQIEYYELPTPVYESNHEVRCLSWGYVINDQCEQWVAWRLANCD